MPSVANSKRSIPMLPPSGPLNSADAARATLDWSKSKPGESSNRYRRRFRVRLRLRVDLSLKQCLAALGFLSGLAHVATSSQGARIPLSLLRCLFSGLVQPALGVCFPCPLDKVVQVQVLAHVRVVFALVDCLVHLLLARHHLCKEVLGVTKAVVHIHARLQVLFHHILPGEHASVGLASEAAGVLLGRGGNHGAICAKLLGQPEALVLALYITVHQACHSVFVTDLGNHAQLSSDGSLTWSHRRRPAVDREAGDACGA
ncbi:hypothetical protein TPAR_07727 [Tolypocladium paradoxum]|uniref:Uncharacterized protein n=1 Tax=Tolypocladium paradoxum TaxID=94208 RepID=A0A2S4KPI2_9HYPO|nr:hypothetical protein TPAR_07727 [Tolypocladium paradoxum]